LESGGTVRAGGHPDYPRALRGIVGGGVGISPAGGLAFDQRNMRLGAWGGGVGVIVGAGLMGLPLWPWRLDPQRLQQPCVRERDNSYPGPMLPLSEAIEHGAHLLPAQGPISIFIHHNTLHAFEDLPFEAAVERAGAVLGTEPFLAESRYRDKLAAGRI